MKPSSERTYRVIQMPDGKSQVIPMRHKIPILYDSLDDEETEETNSDSEETEVRKK